MDIFGATAPGSSHAILFGATTSSRARYINGPVGRPLVAPYGTARLFGNNSAAGSYPRFPIGGTALWPKSKRLRIISFFDSRYHSARFESKTFPFSFPRK